MFESIKIINSCNKFLKQFKIKVSDELNIYKKGILIHCKVDDWRGQIEIDEFPVLTIKQAVCIIIESSIWNHFLELELNNRVQLKSNYLEEYGEYDSRKYIFEETLKHY